MKAIRWLDKYLEAALIAVGLIAIVVVMTAQIICRQLLGFSIIWSEELCRHIFICIACWGLSYSIRIHNAIKFDLIVTFLPWKSKYIFEIISNLFVIAFILYMAIPAWNVSVGMKTISSTALPYHMDLVHFIALFGFLLSAVRAIQVLIMNTKTLISGENPDEEVANK